MPGPRLRVFAGPNGSGKSTIKRILDPELIYIYVNADDLEREAKDGRAIDMAPFAINPTQEVFRDFSFLILWSLESSWHLKPSISIIAGQALVTSGIEVQSYHASVIADFIRHSCLIVVRVSPSRQSCETVPRLSSSKRPRASGIASTCTSWRLNIQRSTSTGSLFG